MYSRTHTYRIQRPVVADGEQPVIKQAPQPDISGGQGFAAKLEPATAQEVDLDDAEEDGYSDDEDGVWAVSAEMEREGEGGDWSFSEEM